MAIYKLHSSIMHLSIYSMHHNIYKQKVHSLRIRESGLLNIAKIMKMEYLLYPPKSQKPFPC